MIPQKKREHYFKSKYNSLERFISYFYQVDLIIGLRNTKEYENTKFNILEIGIGSGLISDHLRKMGFAVTTCDFDETLKPDVVADIRCLPFEANSFEVVTAFEVLEHIPFEDVPKALTELRRVSSKIVILSLPYRSSYLELVLHLPLTRTIFNRNLLTFFLRFPWFFKGFPSSGQHYWEIDGYNYRLGKIKKILKNYFIKVKIVRPVLDGYRLFFVLEK